MSLFACSVADLSPYDAGSSSPNPSPSVTAAASTSASPQSPLAVSSEFSFPKTSCGDQADSPSESWYPVYIDNSDLAQIRSKYCGDAVSTIRNKTGVPSVQVASFTTYGKAQRFATAVGGEVEPVGISRTSLEAQTGSAQTAGQKPDDRLSSSSSTSSGQAVLTSSQPQAPINVRERASTSAAIAHIGYGGDRLSITDKIQGDDGYTWYSVRLESGERGWVRSDFVSQETASASDSSTLGSSVSSDRLTSQSNASAADSSVINPAGTDSSSTDSMRSAVLTASEPNSLINVRTSASTSAEVQTTGYAGDRIQVVDRKQGEDGLTWYSVRFESGTTGWVRSDFVSSN
ncbi:MAG: SH3 domain-containing protein [Oscillatoriophycideae cyanobacterium NC_groundwater_1537_Pr4_S-0.65um_50_18]|nr:SH3 domain-containing protein [Oscillatoriophycideae cyanobacterium NC_groundwater_1537_Pr4_S-0.65um_50_18]